MARVFLLNAQSAPAVVWASEDNLNINNNMINLIFTASFPIRGSFCISEQNGVMFKNT